MSLDGYYAIALYRYDVFILSRQVLPVYLVHHSLVLRQCQSHGRVAEQLVVVLVYRYVGTHSGISSFYEAVFRASQGFAYGHRLVVIIK